MKTLINKLLREIEQEKHIKILFAVESGSRAWGLESENSDYDVRYVYYKNFKEYLKIEKPSEVISTHYDKEGNKIPPEGCFIDCVGFDIFKFTKMLTSSNPTVIEWLLSDIVYKGKQNKVFKEYAKNYFNSISLYWHYSSMCKQIYFKYIKSGNLVCYKKYLYAMRGLVNAEWVLNMKILPPINFNQTIVNLNGTFIYDGGILNCKDEQYKILPYYIFKKLKNIIKLKKTSKEKDIIQNDNQIDDFIEYFLNRKPIFVKQQPDSNSLIKKEILNKEILKILSAH